VSLGGRGPGWVFLANDDLVGCDTTLRWASPTMPEHDDIYGATPPAVGYDFFLGRALREATP